MTECVVCSQPKPLHKTAVEWELPSGRPTWRVVAACRDCLDRGRVEQAVVEQAEAGAGDVGGEVLPDGGRVEYVVAEGQQIRSNADPVRHIPHPHLPSKPACNAWVYSEIGYERVPADACASLDDCDRCAEQDVGRGAITDGGLVTCPFCKHEHDSLGQGPCPKCGRAVIRGDRDE